MSGIIRVNTDEDSTRFKVKKALFQDEKLSWEARGVLGYLLSQGNGWTCRNEDLINKGPAGEHKIKRVLSELRTKGYMHRERIQKDDGTFDWETTVYDSPDLNPHYKSPESTIGRKSPYGEKKSISDDLTIGQLSTDGKSPDGQSTIGRKSHYGEDDEKTPIPANQTIGRLSIGGKPHHIINNKEDKDSNKWMEIWELYQNNINISEAPIVIEQMKHDDYLHLPVDWWREAIQVACDNGVRKWVYVRACLERASEQGVSPLKCKIPERARRSPQQSESAEIVTQQVIPEPVEPDPDQKLWHQILSILETSMTRATYNNLFYQARYERNGLHIIKAGNPQSLEWLEARRPQIEKAFRDANADPVEIKFVV